MGWSSLWYMQQSTRTVTARRKTPSTAQRRGSPRGAAGASGALAWPRTRFGVQPADHDELASCHSPDQPADMAFGALSIGCAEGDTVLPRSLQSWAYVLNLHSWLLAIFSTRACNASC